MASGASASRRSRPRRSPAIPAPAPTSCPPDAARARQASPLRDRLVVDVVLRGVRVRQRVDLLGLGERVVDLHERVPLVRQRVLREDRLHRALGLACPAVDALLGIDHEDPLVLVDAVDGADVDAREVFDVDAGLGDDVRHSPESSQMKPDASREPAAYVALVSWATSSGARSTRADFTITWSKPAVCARWSPALSVVREPDDRNVGPRVDDLVGLDSRD